MIEEVEEIMDDEYDTVISIKDKQIINYLVSGQINMLCNWVKSQMIFTGILGTLKMNAKASSFSYCNGSLSMKHVEQLITSPSSINIPILHGIKKYFESPDGYSSFDTSLEIKDDKTYTLKIIGEYYREV